MGGQQQVKEDRAAIDVVDRAPVTLIDVAHEADLAIVPPAGRFMLVILVRGGGTLGGTGRACELRDGQAVLVSCGEHRLICRSGAKVMLITLPRLRFQALMSRRHGGARLLSRRVLTLSIQGDGRLQRVLHQIQAGRALPASAEPQLFDALGAHLVEAHGLDVAFPGSRSIGVARALLDQSVGTGWDAKSLASRAGITSVTLQRGFRECLGMTVAAYAQGLSLDAARAQLRCGTESRSMMQIAQKSGFRTAAIFARAYQKRFGETPTQTRIHAVKFNNGPHDMD